MPLSLSSEDTVKKIAAETDTVVLMFSCGKDSIAAWLALRPHFRRIVPVYQYLVPGLGFVERSIRYYEEFFGTAILQYPHSCLYRWLSHYTFQAPENCSIITAARVPNFTHEQLRDIVCEDVGLPVGTWTAVGTRAADSQARRMSFVKGGSMNHKKKTFFPVWDWRKERLVGALREAGVKLPAEYRLWGRSFDGLDFRFLHGIKKHWPEDYERILALFPLAELELVRAEFAQRRKVAHG